MWHAQPDSNPGAALWLTWSEPMRAMAELAALLGSSAARRPCTSGNGHPVLVLPGFLGSDSCTSVLRAFLAVRGFAPLPWRCGRNLGPKGDLLDRLVKRVRDCAAAADTPISLVGHSLGGIYAREIAHAVPEDVNLVITLGSPFRCPDGRGADPAVVRLLEMTTGRRVHELWGDRAPRFDAPLPVPSVAVFSKQDGVVNWRSCIETAGSNAENVETSGSHCGLVINHSVLSIVADRLRRHVPPVAALS